LLKQYTTLKDVAQMAGTTAATVSYVLNEKDGRYISVETKRKVLKAAKELDYIKCNGASSLKGKARKLIAILVPQFENQFFTRIIMGAEEVFVKHGYDMVICNTFDNPERERGIIHRMLQQRVDGILLTPTNEGFNNTAVLRRLGMKMVMVDRPMEGEGDFYWVTTDNYGCGYKGASYLMEKGHKKIAYIGWESHVADLDKRREAVLDAAKKNEMPRENIVIKEGAFSADEGYRLTAMVLDKYPDVSAFFYGFNVQALGGIKCLTTRGIDIPKEKSVLIIGSPEWAVTGRNNFTHVDMGDYELGKNAAELLMDMIRNPGKEPAKHTIRDCTLVEGDSVDVFKY
jgi:LacI family transcriptional regulator